MSGRRCSGRRCWRPRGESDVRETAAIITQTKNSVSAHDGYSPAQWVLGSTRIRIPGSLLEEDENSRLETHEAALDPGSAMAINLQRREVAKLAYIEHDSDARVRRALLRKAVPQRGPYPVGAYVYFRRAQVRPGEVPVHRWFGIARVIGHEHPRRRSGEDTVNKP